MGRCVNGSPWPVAVWCGTELLLLAPFRSCKKRRLLHCACIGLTQDPRSCWVLGLQWRLPAQGPARRFWSGSVVSSRRFLFFVFLSVFVSASLAMASAISTFSITQMPPLRYFSLVEAPLVARKKSHISGRVRFTRAAIDLGATAVSGAGLFSTAISEKQRKSRRRASFGDPPELSPRMHSSFFTCNMASLIRARV